jgi:hypothetical protein
MLPPRSEPPAVLPPAERAGALLPQIRSVLSPVTEVPWSVAPAAPRPAREVLDDPTDLCGSLVLAAVEVLSGRRPLVQLTRWVTPQVLELLGNAVQRQEGTVSPSRRQVRAGAGQTARGEVAPARRGRATVRRVHLSRVNAGAAEASVVLHDGERVRAAAVRLEVHRGHWRATVLQIG